MSQDDLFKIGDIARMFHLSVSTLRHYEHLGLVRPEYVDPDSGYRYYSTRQFETLNTLRYLRVLDTPLDRIGAFLQNREIDTMRALLSEQKAVVACRQQELKRIEQKLARRLAQLEDAQRSVFDTITEIEAKPRRIVWLRHELSAEAGLDLEKPLIRLEENQQDAIIFLGKAGVGISRERLIDGRFDRYDRVFLLLEEGDRFEGEADELPGGPCVTLRFRGEHRHSAPYYERLMNYLRQRNWKPADFSREITLIDSGMTRDENQFVTEIEIPIREETI